MSLTTIHERDCGGAGAGDLRRDGGAAAALPGGPGRSDGLVPGHAGGGHASAGDANVAAQLARPTPAVVQPLSLVRIPADMPRTLKLRDGRAALRAAALAEAMLAEGILRESDWQGSLIPSIGAGITRWVAELEGERPLRRLTWGLFWTDDVAQVSGMDTRLWYQAGKGRDPREPVGLLALQSEPTEADHYPAERDVIVGAAVLELEAARKGLGFAMLALLRPVLQWTLCAAFPSWGWEQVVKHAVLWKVLDGQAVPREAVEVEYEELPHRLITSQHRVTPEAWQAVVPEEACVLDYRPGVVKEGLRHLATLPEHLRPIVELAGEVDRFRRIPADALQRWDTHALCATGTRFVDCPGAALVECPFAVRWSADDPLPELVQDYHRMARRNDDSTNLIWSQGWQGTNPDGLRRTVQHFRQVVTLAVRACQLAEALHSDLKGEQSCP